MNRLWLSLSTLFFVSLVTFLFVTPAYAAPPQPKITWSPCYREFGFPFQCSSVQVPIDHNDPGGAAISLAVVRLPASDPAQRIGSLFFNPGGPGGSGVDFVLFAGPFLYNDTVRARFDLVGFDPRGIARSTALRCFGSIKQAVTVFAPFAFPVTSEEEAIWQASDRALVSACEQRARQTLLTHMTTADVARDLDLLRQAVGDAQLTYAGYSYGSYLGVTYANLFPDKVRALVVDGVLDPIAWATGQGNEGSTVPFSTRLRSDAGAQATLNEFFRLCDAGGANCAFAGNAAGRFAALAARLRSTPLLIIFPDGSSFTFTYADLIGNTLGAMYDSASWPGFAQFLVDLETIASPTVLGTRLYSVWEQLGYITKRGFPRYPNFVEGFPGVSCGDSDNPRTYSAWSTAATTAEAQYGYFGRLWTWASGVCATWPGPGEDRYAGPFTAQTANPVLVVGNSYDPATRYEGAVTVAGLLPNARLLTVHGWGHVSLFLSQCADTAVSRYLVSGELPAAGTVCEQDVVPFAQPVTAARQTSSDLSPRQRINPVLVPGALRQQGQARGRLQGNGEVGAAALDDGSIDTGSQRQTTFLPYITK